MGLFLFDVPGDVAVIGTPQSQPKLAHAVNCLGLPVRLADARSLDGAGMLVVDRAAANGFPPLKPAVVVHGLGGHRGLPPLPGPGVAPLGAAGLSATDLLGAMLKADPEMTGPEIARQFPGLPVPLVVAFLQQPRVKWRLSDLERLLQLSRDRTRTWLREHHWGHAAYLRTWCRAQGWIFLVRRGVRREVAEGYLGIGRRQNFVRSCRRSGVPVPWEKLGGSGG